MLYLKCIAPRLQAVSVPAALNANELHLLTSALPATCPSQGGYLLR